MDFDLHVGIDYSGAETPQSRLSGLQVFATDGRAEPAAVAPPLAPRMKRWSRAEVAAHLVQLAGSGTRFFCGIDHAFSFPEAYFERNRLSSWDAFLRDFAAHWPTHETGAWVSRLREGNPRTGLATEYRLAERWTPSAKSVFLFDVQGSVATSTHAGLPWLLHLRQHAAGRVHFWPFDGWDIPAGASVVAEVYPAIFSRRYPRDTRGPDAQDAWATARWLAETARRGFLDRYLHPPLTDAERATAALEGWILGVA